MRPIHIHPLSALAGGGVLALAALLVGMQGTLSIERIHVLTEEQAEILSPDALRFVAALASEFDSTRRHLLEKREERQAEIDEGRFPDFLEETRQKRGIVIVMPYIFRCNSVGNNLLQQAGIAVRCEKLPKMQKKLKKRITF